MPDIVAATTESQYQQIRELLAEHIAWDTAQTERLGLDPQEVLSFYYASGQETLPGEYAPPEGHLLLATEVGQTAGCVAYQRMMPDICEMKRLYVRPQFRGQRLGRQLVRMLIAEARLAGYRTMRLETTTFMEKAIATYSSLGFLRCEPYYNIPESFMPITVFMELDLTA
jgi:ribosomal protein S18 acetylase RimI-like enzyme